MTFSFRIRFKRAPGFTLNSNQRRQALPEVQTGISLTLCAADPEKPIEQSEHLALIGNGFGGADEARAAGTRFGEALLVTLASFRAHVPVDFGWRGPKGAFTPYGLDWLAQQSGHKRVLDDVHGSMTYPTLPEPRFARSGMTATIGISLENFQSTFLEAAQAKPIFSERERTAFPLFNLAYFSMGIEARFILLVMAVEALLEPQPRNSPAIRHVEKLIMQTRLNFRLSCSDRTSLIGSLEWLRSESIGQSSRRLVSARLGNRRYGTKKAAAMFTECYHLRSRLVHGTHPYPETNEIAAALTHLDRIVSDLLTVPWLALGD